MAIGRLIACRIFLLPGISSCGMGVSNMATLSYCINFDIIGIAVSSSRKDPFGSRSSLKSVGTTLEISSTCLTISHQGRGLFLKLV